MKKSYACAAPMAFHYVGKHTPKEVLQILLDAFHQSTALIREHYSFTKQE